MNKNRPNQNPDPGKEQHLSPGIQESIYPGLLLEPDISDGGEFLDDAIRMKEQPYNEKPKEE